MADLEVSVVVDDSEKVIRRLADAAALGKQAAEVEILQTHLSWILLAGSYAFKIKKPIDLGFADFSNLPQRRHFCAEELRVNRRLLPEFYLDVVPITGSRERPRLGGDGEPIEYAVKMKRFPQESLLPEVLARDALTAEQVDELIGQLAEFHDRIEVHVDQRLFGTPHAIRGAMEANFEAIEHDTHDARIDAQLRRLREWADEEFHAREEDFTTRKQQGFVRECHGDLHLGNMFLWNDSVKIFDAIEFNEGLRWIDVLSEIAFLVMDLQERGRVDWSRRVLSGYLEATGGYHGMRVLPYYLAYRALVRAKVSAIRIRQAGVGEEERRRLRRELDRYLELAEAPMQRPAPRLIITHGLSGTGKTTGAERLVETLGAIRIRSDVERKRIFGLDPRSKTGAGIYQGIYSPDATEQCYQRLAELAEEILRAGFTAVVDAAFLKRHEREMLHQVADRLGTPFRIVDFHADEKTLAERLAGREQAGTDASEARAAVLASQLQSQEPLREEERQATVGVNTGRFGWAKALKQALQANL